MADTVDRKRKMRRRVAFGAVPVLQRDIGWARKSEIVGNGAQPVGDPVGAGQNIDYSCGRPRRRYIDAPNFGMRMNGIQHEGLQLTVDVIVVGKLAPAGQQAKIFLAERRLADHGGHREYLCFQAENLTVGGRWRCVNRLSCGVTNGLAVHR
jgi:hypothetical protein